MSPLLFILVMTVIMNDAVDLLSPAARRSYDQGDLADLVYADDTLLFGGVDARVNECLHAVASVGRLCGMELHWGKFQVLGVQCQPRLLKPDGIPIDHKASLQYFGTVLEADGSFTSELGRRIGIAKADSAALSRVWRHSSLTWRHKLKIYTALIESRFLYSLSTTCLTIAEQRRLNGVQNKFVRSILNIKAAYYSRVSNDEVLRRADYTKATTLLLRRQLLLYGKIARAPYAQTMRQAAFVHGTTYPVTSKFVRRMGRPRKEWVSSVQR